MSKTPTSIKSVHATPEDLIGDVMTSSEPLLLKGLVTQWPAVRRALESDTAISDYLVDFDSKRAVTVYHIDPSQHGRVFYNHDFSGFNFSRQRGTISQVVRDICSSENSKNTAGYYIGSTMLDQWLPGFTRENDVDLGGQECLKSIWIGNQSNIAAHFDFPNNIACCVAGRRRFRLFPPDQIDNLYIGPLDMTPSGQPISLVDGCAPDFVEFPRYRDALENSCLVELEPGDAIMIPSMWWHQVESMDKLNILVNYWWRVTPSYQGSPMSALLNAVMSVRDLPDEQKQHWQRVFDYYVFSDKSRATEHLVDSAKGVLGEVDEEKSRAIKNQLVSLFK